jgi:hypothetical protein
MPAIDEIKLNEISGLFELELVTTSNAIKNLSDDQDKKKLKKMLKKMSVIHSCIQVLNKYRDTL